MQWQVGQRIVCDRPDQPLTGCCIASSDADTVKIICPAAGIVVYGPQQRLEEMGWKLEQLQPKN